MTSFAWGSTETQYFFELTPERILSSVEALGFQCTGRCLALNSMENRVYEVEVEVEESPEKKISPSERFRIIKFYRPGRWSKEQILDEHTFLLSLAEHEIPAVPPLVTSGGTSLHQVPGIDIWYAVFPKIGGRQPDEFSDEELERVGRLLARVHGVGQTLPSAHRIALNVDTYGENNLAFLVNSKSIPPEIEPEYVRTVKELCEAIRPLFENINIQTIHGDCHLGNLLSGREGFFLVDFDDMVRGPTVQDVWLLVPGRGPEARRQREVLLSAYEQMRPFHRQELRLIEPLRALRYIHFSAWIAMRFQDPAFQRTFVNFGTDRYWREQLSDLQEQLDFIRNPEALLEQVD